MSALLWFWLVDNLTLTINQNNQLNDKLIVTVLAISAKNKEDKHTLCSISTEMPAEWSRPPVQIPAMVHKVPGYGVI